jgi:hypothetical protein
LSDDFRRLRPNADDVRYAAVTDTTLSAAEAATGAEPITVRAVARGLE